MRPYEFEGKNEEDAVAKACRTLNLTRDELQIKVLEPGSAGIFGLVGGRKARIKAVPIVKETVPEEKPAAPEKKTAVPAVAMAEKYPRDNSWLRKRWKGRRKRRRKRRTRSP